MLSTSSASTLTACHGTIRLVKTIGSRIAAQRKTLGLSQGELARLIHRTRSTVSQLEAGTTHDPKPETLLAYAKHLRMSVEYLVTGEVDRTLRVESPELSYEGDLYT
jgi:transcriptional regulator with XRE-family HTH domain